MYLLGGMRKYKKIYTDFFGYVQQDFIPSELSGLPANHIHHIIYRSHGGKDEIENLMALTHHEHQLAHDKAFSKGYLQEVHDNFMKNYEREWN